MIKTVSALLLTGFSLYAVANDTNDITFKDTKTLLQGEDVSHFVLKDLNNDARLDIVWKTSNGDIKYKLQDNQAIATLENLPGTKWRISYDNSNYDKFLEFFNERGVITDHYNNQFNLVNVSVTELNQLTFCTDINSGLNKTRCRWNYQVTEVLPHVMKGKDLKTGETWVAYKLVN